jgi:hypothetical protein
VSDTKHLEDRVILAALEGEPLEDGRLRPLVPRAAGDESAETLERLYVELLGVIPQELDPIPPRPELKRSLMARIAAEPAAAEPAAAEPAAEPAETVRPAAAVAPHPRFAPRTERPRRSWAYLAAAAMVLLALGGFFFLYGELVEGRQTIAQLEQERQRAEKLEQELVAVERQLQHTTAKLQGEIVAANTQVEFLLGIRGDLTDAMRRLSVQAPETIEYCPLRPVGAEPVQPRAAGSLVLVMSDGRWYLKIRNLQPAEAGKVYTLWILDEQDVPLARMPFVAGPDQQIELARQGIPMGLETALVTLEPSAETDRPTGPRILHGRRQEMERL